MPKLAKYFNKDFKEKLTYFTKKYMKKQSALSFIKKMQIWIQHWWLRSPAPSQKPVWYFRPDHRQLESFTWQAFFGENCHPYTRIGAQMVHYSFWREFSFHFKPFLRLLLSGHALTYICFSNKAPTFRRLCKRIVPCLR